MNSNLHFNRSFVTAVFAVFALSHGALTQAQALAPGQAQSRGEMLYSTHCIACHTTEIHWRDKSLVTNWDTLKKQIQRWQGVAGLGWSEADMLEVARYLNQIHYRFEPATIPIASAGPPRVQ